MIQDSVSSIDPDKKTVKLASGKTLRYDKVVVSPGVALMMNSIEGLAQANKAGITLQAWKAGPETIALHKQLTAMRDGGTYAISIPEAHTAALLDHTSILPSPGIIHQRISLNLRCSS
jgi:hypothetical protein